MDWRSSRMSMAVGLVKRHGSVVGVWRRPPIKSKVSVRLGALQNMVSEFLFLGPEVPIMTVAVT